MGWNPIAIVEDRVVFGRQTMIPCTRICFKRRRSIPCYGQRFHCYIDEMQFGLLGGNVANASRRKEGIHTLAVSWGVLDIRTTSTEGE